MDLLDRNAPADRSGDTLSVEPSPEGTLSVDPGVLPLAPRRRAARRARLRRLADAQVLDVRRSAQVQAAAGPERRTPRPPWTV